MQNPPLLIEITVNPSDPELLEGLDVWLRLGLISEEQLRQLSQTHLSCPLPEPVAVASVEGIEGSQRSKTDFASQAILLKGKAPLTKFRNFFAQAWQAFKDELSVRWLLFLGLFLVVASSGVLAATQWERFPDSGQYLVLLTYTLIFWGVGFWASKQENLPLTSQTLKAITLLLVPVNFWAMDAFDLWEHFGGWFAVAIASISFTSLYYLYNKPRQSLFLFFNFIGLCYLHWGWGFSEFPLIAVYFGAIATGIVLRCLPRWGDGETGRRGDGEQGSRGAGEQGSRGSRGSRGRWLRRRGSGRGSRGRKAYFFVKKFLLVPLSPCPLDFGFWILDFGLGIVFPLSPCPPFSPAPLCGYSTGFDTKWAGRQRRTIPVVIAPK